MVLAHVLSRLSSTASSSNVTVQIFKDDWTQLSAATKFYYNKSCSDTASGKSHGGHSHSHDHGSHGGHSHEHGGSHGGHSHDHGGSHGGHSHDHSGSHGGHSHDHGGSHGGHSHEHGGSHGGHSHDTRNSPRELSFGSSSFESNSPGSEAIPRRFTQHQQFMNGPTGNPPTTLTNGYGTHSGYNGNNSSAASNPMKMI